MKQKILVKVQMHCHKCRTKALKIAASVQGVSRVSIEGANEDHVEVIGDGVDSICLTKLLRKKVGYAAIVEVEQIKGDDADDEEENPTPAIQYWTPSASYAQYCTPHECPPTYHVVVREYPEPITCSIM